MDSEHVYIPVEDMTALLASNMILYRTSRIRKYRDILKDNMDKMRVEKDPKKQVQLCEDIRKNIATIYQMISENSDDAANFESVIAASREPKTKDPTAVPYIW